MLDFIKRNNQFVFLILIWVLCGLVQKDLASLVVLGSVILLKMKGRYIEIVLAFMFLLVMSDNRQSAADYAKDVKNVYIILLSLFVFFDRKNFKYKSTLFLNFLPFFLMAFIALSQGPGEILSQSFQKTLSYVLLFTVMPVYFNKLFHEHGTFFLKEVFYTCTIILLIGIIYIPIFPDTVFLVGRFSGIFGNPNGIGIFCTLFFLFVYTIYSKFPGLITQNERNLAYALIAASVLLAVSRNTMFSIILFLFFVRFYKISYWYGFIILIVTGMVYQIINNNLVDILKAIGLGEYLRADNLENGSGRTFAWAYALKLIQHQFLMGKGFYYDDYIFFLNRHWLSAEGHQGGCHSTWLSLWLNTGIIGLILFLAGFFKTFFSAAVKSNIAIPIMFAVMFSATFEGWLQGSLNPFTIHMLLLVSIITSDELVSKPVDEPEEEQSLIPVL